MDGCINASITAKFVVFHAVSLSQWDFHFFPLYLQCCEKVFAPLPVSFIFTYLSHLNVAFHQTNYKKIRQNQVSKNYQSKIIFLMIIPLTEGKDLFNQN